MGRYWTKTDAMRWRARASGNGDALEVFAIEGKISPCGRWGIRRTHRGAWSLTEQGGGWTIGEGDRQLDAEFLAGELELAAREAGAPIPGDPRAEDPPAPPFEPATIGPVADRRVYSREGRERAGLPEELSGVTDRAPGWSNDTLRAVASVMKRWRAAGASGRRELYLAALEREG